VAAVLIAFALSCWTLAEKIKKAREPKDKLAQWQQETDDKLQNDKKRLDSLEKGQGVMLRGINAIISHEINGNSTEKLTKSQQEIMDYLINR
jgi:hypothetical protein